ncbi:hypothetical protein GCM10010402_53840 [Actinomadura luteofluorescens]
MVGASPLLALAALGGVGQLRPLLTWVPDAFVAACAAACAGAVLAALRLTSAVRAPSAQWKRIRQRRTRFT